jgi:hypothetical protein
MGCLLKESILGHKHWEVAVLDAELLDASIEKRCNLLPNVVSWRSQNVASWNVVVLDEFRLCDYLRVPLWKVLFFLILNAQLVRICNLLRLLLFLLGGSFLFLHWLGSFGNRLWPCGCFQWADV